MVRLGGLGPQMTGQSTTSEIRRGFVAMLPFWFGVVPFALAFGILARTSDFSVVETQLLSVLVFAGSAQLAFVNLAQEGSGAIAIVLTVLLLNLRHVLYGLSLNAYLPAKTKPPRALLAAGLVDESYGLTIRAFLAGHGSAGYLFGASLSLFVSYTASTLVGAMLGSRLPDPERLGLATIFPLSFLALLIPLVRTRIDLSVAVASGTIGLIASQFFNGGVVVLTATIAAALFGMTLESRSQRS
jgi:4-azaleucine resistance transporter AzlC